MNQPLQMVLILYSGPAPERVVHLLDQQHVGGYTEFRGAHGSGATGRREDSRAWPGASTLFLSVAPEQTAQPLVNALRQTAASLDPGERLHVAVIPAESFF